MMNIISNFHPSTMLRVSRAKPRDQSPISKESRPRGYIALIALLIVAATALTIGLAVSFASLNEIKISFAASQAQKAKALSSACLEDGLEKLRQNWSNYAGSLSIDGNSCIINTEINGNQATLVTTGAVDIYNQKIQVQADNNLNIISWQEE